MRLITLGLVSLLLAVAVLTQPNGAVLSAGPSLFQLSAGTVNASVTVTGRLELQGRDYFLDPRFAIVDDQGNRIPVMSWVPLEAPLSPAGRSAATAPQFRTMRDYFDHRFRFSGIHRVVAERMRSVGALGESYLEVQNVTDLGAGKAVFSSTSDAASPTLAPEIAKPSTSSIRVAPVALPTEPLISGVTEPFPTLQAVAINQLTTSAGADPIAVPVAPMAAGVSGPPPTSQRVGPGKSTEPAPIGQATNQSTASVRASPFAATAAPARSDVAGTPPVAQKVGRGGGR